VATNCARGCVVSASPTSTRQKPSRAILLERYLVKRINALNNRHRSPHQKSRGQLPVPGG
jgi:hypothetical protein